MGNSCCASEADKARARVRMPNNHGHGVTSTEDSSSMQDHNKEDMNEGIAEMVLSMNSKYPKLVQTFQRDFGYTDNIWSHQASDGGNDREVVDWFKNQAGLEEKHEENG